MNYDIKTGCVGRTTYLTADSKQIFNDKEVIRSLGAKFD